MTHFLSVLACAIVTLFSGVSHSAEPNVVQSGSYRPDQLGPPDGEGPTAVRTQFHLQALHNIDDETETFRFSGVLTLIWKDPRQAFDPQAEGVSRKFYNGAFQFNELSPAWYPQVALANASEVGEPQGVIIQVEPDGTSTLVQTITAEARSRLDLRRYPFDSQRLEANFFVLGFDATEVVLTAGSGAATVDRAFFQVPQWELVDIGTTTGVRAAPDLGSGSESSVLSLRLDMDRKPFFMIRLVVFPLLLIVLLSLSVFWMDRSSLGDRMSVSFVGILTAVAYQIMVSDIMPQISYVTLMNAALNFSFLVMCATVVINLRVGVLDKRGEFERGERLDRRCRVIFPLVLAGLLALSAFIAFVWF